MELTHLRYFIAVAEELHFGRAARRLRMAQPPLSQRIRKLEAELGVDLLRRTSRRVELTPAGRIFLEEAREIVGRADNCVATMRQFATGSRGTLTVGFNEPALGTFLSHAVRRFVGLYPGVRLFLKELQTMEQLEALAAGGIHLGIMRPFGCDLSSFGWKVLWEERYVLALPADHPLKSRKKVPLRMLREERFVMFPRSVNPALYANLRDCCRKVGFTPQVVQEAVSKQTILALVEAGLGVALVPESSRHLSPPGVSFRPIDGELPGIEIDAVWRREGDMRNVERFLEVTDASCRSRPMGS